MARVVTDSVQQAGGDDQIPDEERSLVSGILPSHIAI